MKRARTGNPIMFLFSVVTGGVIGALVWLYLKGSNVGITLIWEIIPEYFSIKHYTIVMCLIGGLVIGLFHHFFGKYPDNINEAVKNVMDEKTYPYNKMLLIVIGAFLPLFFGGAVGPEAGLVCIIAALCFWAVDELRVAMFTVQDMIAANQYVGSWYVFRALMKGTLSRPNNEENIRKTPVWKRREQVVTGVSAGLSGLIVYLVFCAVFGRVFNLPHLDSGEIYVKERFLILLMILIGIAAGYLYLLFHKIANTVFDKLRTKNLHILNAILGGLVLGIIGTILPVTMFSGGNDIQTLQYTYLSSTPYMLIIIGVVKLFLTNVCIESGWRGGHFFPVLFAGLSIGYGFATMLGTNEIVSVVVVSCALLATMFQQPIGALFLGAIFFPLEDLGWMLIASFVAGCIPVPAVLRVNPDRKGFIYSIIHRKESQFKLPVFK